MAHEQTQQANKSLSSLGWTFQLFHMLNFQPLQLLKAIFGKE
jgi:hypothetical protein